MAVWESVQFVQSYYLSRFYYFQISFCMIGNALKVASGLDKCEIKQTLKEYLELSSEKIWLK